VKETAVSFLMSEGYSPCDIAACNCGSFHGGHAYARLREIHDALGWERIQGKTALTAVQELMARQQESEGRRCSECGDEVQRLLCGHCHCCGDPRCKSCYLESEGVVVEMYLISHDPAMEIGTFRVSPMPFTVQGHGTYRLTRIEGKE